MLVAVTGGSGFIGSMLIRELLARGHKVRALVRSNYGPLKELSSGCGVEFVRGDVMDYDSLLRLWDGAELAVHLAAIISIDGDPTGKMMETNVEGARLAALAALKCQVPRYVHVSSCHAFDLASGGSINEASPLASPRSAAYDRSKRGGMEAVLQVCKLGLDAVIVNPVGVVGPGDWNYRKDLPSRTGQIVLDVYNRGFPALVSGGFDWVDVRDVVQGILLAAEKGRQGQCYLLSNEHKSIVEFVKICAEECGERPPLLYIPSMLAYLACPFASLFYRVTGSEPRFTRESIDTLNCDSLFDTKKARAELGWVPQFPFVQSIRDLYAWFETNDIVVTKMKPPSNSFIDLHWQIGQLLSSVFLMLILMVLLGLIYQLAR